jgi:P4 family phage/plasmid primase-like protien
MNIPILLVLPIQILVYNNKKERNLMSKPNALSVIFSNIPMELKQIPRWVLWSHTEVGPEGSKRWSKIPLQPNNQQAKANDPSTWSDFLTVQAAYEKNPHHFSGVGFVFCEDDNIVGVDLDDCYDADLKSFTNVALQQIATSINGYMEISPSGTGVKIFTRSNLKNAHVDHNLGFEAYPHGRYFTVTGQHLTGLVPTEEQDLTEVIPTRTVHITGDDFADYKPPVPDYDLARIEKEILSQLDYNCGYTDWLNVGQALHHQFGGDPEACDLWERWAYADGNATEYQATGPMSTYGKWGTFKRESGSTFTLRSLIFKVNAKVRKEALERGEIILDQGPMNNARCFLDNLFASEEGYTLVHYAEDFFMHVGTHYEIIEEATVRSKLYAFLDRCKKSGKKGELVAFNPAPASVSAAMDAVKSITHLPNHPNTKPPIWLDNYQLNNPDSGNLISLKNGLFHLKDYVVLPHSLGFFTQNSLPFAYDPTAECPEWMKFLQSLWPNDRESIDTLQEMFGYIISGDTRQQKFFNLIGPRRSGKGTINKVLVELLGQHNTVAPQLEELCDTFGLQPWLGKLLASFTDARAPERNRSAVVSQLLRIVGGDTVTVNRKNKEAWNGYLPTRLVVYSNEVLQLTENSNALTGRMIVLRMNQTFMHKEDTNLFPRLAQELSGIFNWAMEGLKRRLARGGHFIQPKSGESLLELMAEIGNPIGSFVEDALEFDPLGTVPKDDVFSCFKRWALAKSLPPGTELAFKRRFLAATQEHQIDVDIDRTNGGRIHIYRGVKLNAKAKKFVESIESFHEEVF